VASRAKSLRDFSQAVSANSLNSFAPNEIFAQRKRVKFADRAIHSLAPRLLQPKRGIP
jgi:hypothetical protein